VRLMTLIAACLVMFGATAFSAFAADFKGVGYDDTPVQPNGKWKVHDATRKPPPVVTPGAFSTAAKPGAPPSDAIVLVGPKADTSKWQMKEGGGPVTWKMKGGVLESGKGYIRTNDEFTDVQLHVEFATPTKVEGDSQKRGNSGVFLLGAFEVQVLDSYDNVTYADGQAASLYGQYPPLVNASQKPGQWQVYDIAFFAPRFKDGKIERPAMVTVLHNGVVVHHGTQFFGPTSHRKNPPYAPEQAKGPIALQDHGNPIRYRNIWIRPLKGYDEQ